LYARPLSKWEKSERRWVKLFNFQSVDIAPGTCKILFRGIPALQISSLSPSALKNRNKNQKHTIGRIFSNTGQAEASAVPGKPESSF
jgi:hypothetical protein